MKRSFKLFTIFGIPIEINYSWFIILALVIFSLARGYFPEISPELSPPFHWLMAAAAALLLFASLLAHELSHSLVAVRNNLPIQGITLFVFGGVAHLTEEPSDPGVEFKMAAAGPIMSFSLSALFFFLTQALYNLAAPLPLVAITNYLFIINLAVGIFNLIPGFPLDGGRIFRSIIWAAGKDLRKATSIASAFGKGFAYFLIAAGFLNFFAGSVISGIWFIFIGFFLMEAAEMSYRQVVLKKTLSGIRVGDIMTRNVVTVSPEMTLDKMLDDYFFRFRFAAFPVVEDDALVGLVTFHSVKDVERERWPATTVREAMVPLSDRLIIGREREVIEALTKMAGSETGRLLVAEDGKLIGILSQRDILRLFQLRSEIGGK